MRQVVITDAPAKWATVTTKASSRALIGYAVLRANFNYDAPSYLDNFSAFVLDSLARTHPGAADEARVGEDVREVFGLTIPDRVVGKLLRRLVQKGTVTQLPDRKYVLATEELARVSNIQADVVGFERQQAELAHKFLAFVEKSAPEHLLLVRDAPEQHLSDFVEDNAVPLLTRAMRGESSGSPSVPHSEGPEYLVASFINYLGSEDNVAFGYLVEAVKGAILSTVVDFGPGNLKRKLRGLTLILDTPVVLKALGYLGVTHQRAVLQTLNLAKTLDARIICFDHTIREIDGVLDSVEPVIRTGGRRAGTLREVDAHFLNSGSTAADIAIERGNLAKNLSTLGVHEDYGPQDYYAYGLDEARLDDLLQEVVQYRSAGTRHYDLKSLSAIHRMREGSSPREFERCGYVLVTDNGKLVRAAEKVDERHGWPLAMTDNDLAALLWIRCPAVAEDLPRNQLLATVYAGMQPGGHLWSKYLQEIERLKTLGRVDEDDALFLRARPEAKRALMDVTLGETRDVTAGSVEEVLERMRREIRQPVLEQLAQAESHRDQANDLARQASMEQAAAQAERDQLDKHNETLRGDIEGLRSLMAGQSDCIRAKARKDARRWVSVATYCLATILIGAAALGIAAPNWVGGLAPRYVVGLRICVGILAVLGLWVLFAGGAVREWARPLDNRLAGYLERRRLSAGFADLPAVARVERVTKS